MTATSSIKLKDDFTFSTATSSTEEKNQSTVNLEFHKPFGFEEKSEPRNDKLIHIKIPIEFFDRMQTSFAKNISKKKRNFLILAERPNQEKKFYLYAARFIQIFIY